MYVRSICSMVLLQLRLSAVFAQSAAVEQLPVTANAPAGSDKHPMVLFISGDGGMKKFSVNMADAFTSRGYAVVALN
ncbi:MAG TPA: hypothetical protein VGD35_05865, partial [Chitinophaga sp.]